MQLKGKHVLVIGSETPWLESMLLTKGAKMVSTLEYKKLQSTHPQIQTLMPDEFDQLYWNGTRFDALVTYSSLEHSGLGRYGDRLNPWGDLITLAKSWCILKPKSLAMVGVPAYKDYLFYNMNRRYGLKTLPHLFANWQQIHRDDDDGTEHLHQPFDGWFIICSLIALISPSSVWLTPLTCLTLLLREQRKVALAHIILLRFTNSCVRRVRLCFG